MAQGCRQGAVEGQWLYVAIDAEVVLWITTLLVRHSHYTSSLYIYSG